jgi:hypothetical protein
VSNIRCSDSLGGFMWLISTAYHPLTDMISDFET